MLHDEFTVWPKPVQDQMRKHAQVTYRKLSTAPDTNYRDPAKRRGDTSRAEVSHRAA
jgi:cation transport regulator ChaB